MEEARGGGLIDRYWIFEVIIMPLILLSLIIGIIYIIGLYLNCPYIEDVSSCFPYNLPNWAKWCFTLIIIVIVIVLIYLIRNIKRM